jgi:TonB family protein
MVLANGKIDSIGVVKGLGVEFDGEAIRIIKLMPNWIPGQQDGKPVRCKYTLPILFELENKKEESIILSNEENEIDTLEKLPLQNDGDNITILCIEPMPQFPGGMKELSKFFQDNLQYPKEAETHKTQGKVLVSFWVLENGKIDSVSVMKGIGYGCDEEAIRVVKMMPGWTPGTQGGRPVKIRYTLLINFSL